MKGNENRSSGICHRESQGKGQPESQGGKAHGYRGSLHSGILAGRGRRLAIWLGWILFWQFLALVAGNPLLVPSPLETVRKLWVLLQKLDFYQAVGSTLLRISAGALCGFLVAAALAAGSYRIPLLGEVISPVIGLMKTVPVASFVVVVLVWLGSSFLAVAVSFLVVVPGIYHNTLEGLRHTDRKLLEMAQVFGLSGRARFFYLYRPALAPFLVSGLQPALGMCWKAGVAAEVIGIPRFSLGEQLYLSKIYLDTAGIFAQTAVIVVLSVLLEHLTLWLVGRFLVWEPKVRRKGIARRRTGDRGTVGDRGNPKDRKTTKNRKTGLPGQTGTDLVLSHVWKAYGDRQVLQDVSRTYRQGETYLLRSPSGSGKTTLFRLLCGLEEPDGGRIVGEVRISVLFQEDRLCEAYSALGNVELVTGDRERAARALEELLELDVLGQPAGTLSGGMKRRVALVRAMEAESDMVLLDEPFTGMDPETRKQAEAYIRERQQGRTLLIASHI